MAYLIKPISEVTQLAMEALIREIGVVDTIRFLNQFRTRFGDFTAERHSTFKDASVRDLLAEIRARRSPIT